MSDLAIFRETCAVSRGRSYGKTSTEMRIEQFCQIKAGQGWIIIQAKYTLNYCSVCAAHHKRNIHGYCYSPIFQLSIAKMPTENSPQSGLVLGSAWVWWLVVVVKVVCTKCTPAQCSTLSWSETPVRGTSWLLQRCKFWFGELMFKCFSCLYMYHPCVCVNTLNLLNCSIHGFHWSQLQRPGLSTMWEKRPVQDACAEKESSWNNFVGHHATMGD